MDRTAAAEYVSQPFWEPGKNIFHQLNIPELSKRFYAEHRPDEQSFDTDFLRMSPLFPLFFSSSQQSVPSPKCGGFMRGINVTFANLFCPPPSSIVILIRREKKY